jgi:hypothetical protein
LFFFQVNFRGIQQVIYLKKKIINLIPQGMRRILEQVIT